MSGSQPEGNDVPADDQETFVNPPEPTAAAPKAAFHATRAQRITLIIGLLVVFWLALDLFASVLAPFVAAAVLAYALDPPTTRLARLGLPRGAAALLMILAVLAGVLLFALLLYPLVIVQISLLVNRIPQYATLVQGWAREVLTHLQQNFGPDVVNDKLRDLVSGQAGSMLSILLSTVTGLIGGSFAIFNLLSLAVVTPVVGF
jgi:predicted PurR-regulated permease PerM